MTEAYKEILEVESHKPVHLEYFGVRTAERGEMRIGAVEMKRYSECSVSPAPDNDVIVAAVAVVRSQTLITTLETVGKERLTEAVPGWCRKI
jgi:hypothetical protein